MAANAVELCNRALQRIGHTRRISSLAEPSPEAQSCALHFDSERDLLLEACRWPFATRRVVLAELEDVERTDWCHVFQAPADMLAAQYVVAAGVRNPTAEQRIPYQLEASDNGEGLVVLCDLEAPELVYTAKHTHVPTWSPGFCAALECALGAQLARAVKKDERLAQVLLQEAAVRANAAATLAANQRQDDVEQEGSFIRARYS